MIVDQKSQAILATAFGKGSIHDFHLFQISQIRLSADICSLADTGYLGMGKLHANSQIPFRNTRWHALTEEQKIYNHKLSSERIFIENVIRRLKIFRILSERYRNRRKRFGLRFNLIAAIYNMELTFCKV